MIEQEAPMNDASRMAISKGVTPQTDRNALLQLRHLDYASLFEAQVARAPQRVALRTLEGACLSYHSLNVCANRLAHRLAAHGAGPEIMVGVFLDRSVEMVVTMLAVQKVGGVCVPLETSYPAERLKAMLEDTDAALVVTCQALLSKLPASSARLLCVDLPSDICKPDDRNPRRALKPSSATQVMFTSGSSGRPKGVTLTHAGLVNFLLSMIETPGMDGGDVILSLANYTFDPSLVEIYQPLLVGAQCVLIPRHIAIDGMALWRCLQQVKPTILNATPATFKMLLEAGWSADHPRMKIICGGETMSPTLAQALLARSTTLWNVYGPTETTALCALHQVRRAENPIPIGRAMPNMRLHILPPSGRQAAVGEVGELCIGGVCVSRGYLKRDILTRDKFIADPFASDPTARLYRSGDRARYQSDGTIELLGRIDDQVKLNGHRIEPSEIEAVLEMQPSVRQAVVMVREAADEAILVAYIETARTDAPLDEELRALVRRFLPSYMMPAAFVRLSALPLNANAKLDRQALQAMPLVSPDSDARPENAIEARLIRLFQEVLQFSAIGLHDDFSALGLDSLSAVRIARKIEVEFELKLPVGLLLRSHNVHQIATALLALSPHKFD